MPTKELLLSDRLDREWTALRHRRDVVATVPAPGASRRGPSPTSTSCSASPATGRRARAEHNEVLAPPRRRRQARRAGGTDRAAADPARPARRRPPAGERAERHGAFEELIGAAWMAIRCCSGRATADPASPPTSSATPPTGRSPPRPPAVGDRGVGRPADLDETPATTDGQPVRGARRARSPRDAAPGCRARDLDLVRDLVRVGSPGVLAAAAQGHAAHDPQPPRPRRPPQLAPRGARGVTARSASKFGRRFSRNAAMPSWASAVVAAAAITLTAYS